MTYGEQSLWLLESMIGIILCELRYYMKCQIYFNKLIDYFQSTSNDNNNNNNNNNLFYGILLLKYIKYFNMYYSTKEANYQLWCIAYNNIMGFTTSTSDCSISNTNNDHNNDISLSYNDDTNGVIGIVNKNNESTNFQQQRQHQHQQQRLGLIPFTHPLFVEMMKIRDSILFEKYQANMKQNWEEVEMLDESELNDVLVYKKEPCNE